MVVRLTSLPALVALALGATLAGWSPPAKADGDACLAAPVEGQQLQRAGKLLAARDRFAACARKTCPAEIVQDCTRWEQQVASAVPSVVLVARDGKGRDLVDVAVAIDGQPDVAVSARAVELDPGSHRFVFRRRRSADVEVNLLLREGERDRPVAATFGVPAPPRPSPVEEPTATPSRPVPVAAWIAGAVGVLGFASFATFGALGVSDRASSGCGVGCSQSQKDHVDGELRAADVSLGVGVVALGVATWLYLARPIVAASEGILFDVRPAPGGGFATLGARF
jgi:hypothetical protein